MTHDYTPKVFDRANPCTKVDLWNCFREEGRFVHVAVIHARTKIGLNAPKFLLKQGYAEMYTNGGVDLYRLTKAGEEWLTKGLSRYLELHPDMAGACTDMPPGYHRPAPAFQARQAPAKPATRPLLRRRSKPE